MGVVYNNEDETIDIWPWGERWFLPHSRATGEVKDWVFAIGHLETLTDSRIRARLIRWFWIKAHLFVWHWRRGRRLK